MYGTVGAVHVGGQHGDGVAIDTSKLNWHDGGLCAQVGDDELFFPDEKKTAYVLTQRAKALCQGCPVLSECLAWVRANPQDFGVWGGMSPRERRKEIAERKAREAKELEATA